MARKKKEPPRIVVKTTRVYERIPQTSDDIEAYGYYNASFHKYPINNPHWEYLPMLNGDDGFYLSNICETHYDKKGRPVHEFNESKDGIIESSWIYVELPDGGVVKVNSISDGSVYVEYGNKSWSLKKGGFGWGMIEPKIPAEQIAFEEYDYKMSFGEDNHQLTPEEQAEYERRSAEASKEIVTSKDKYGNPRSVEYWYCGILQRVYDYDYVYANEEKENICAY